jgi:isopentenyl-diphosphate delta-isomerase
MMRKRDHVEIALEGRAEIGLDVWRDLKLLSSSIPDFDPDEVDLTAEFLGRKLEAPLMIGGMTGGYPGAKKINESLSKAAEAKGIGFGLGSQRAALEDSSMRATYVASGPLIVANIGLADLKKLSSEELAEMCSSVNAHALAVHINPLQEVIQPEGKWEKWSVAPLKGLKLPTIGKETGCGMSRGVANKLKDLGFSALDVSGVGGTSFALIESIRAEKKGDSKAARYGRAFAEWGVPTPISIIEANVGLELISSGGIRNGLQIAISLALGATICSIARPFLEAGKRGWREVANEIESLEDELKIALFLMGKRRPKELSMDDVVIVGETRDWLEGRKLCPR